MNLVHHERERFEIAGALRRNHGFVPTAARGEEQPEVRVANGKMVVNLDGAPDLRFGSLPIPFDQQHGQPNRRMSLGEARIQICRAPCGLQPARQRIGRRDEREVTADDERLAKPGPAERERRITLDRSLEVRDGVRHALCVPTYPVVAASQILMVRLAIQSLAAPEPLDVITRQVYGQRFDDVLCGLIVERLQIGHAVAILVTPDLSLRGDVDQLGLDGHEFAALEDAT